MIKIKQIIGIAGSLVAGLIYTGSVLAETPSNSFRVNVAGNGTGTISSIEYEHLVGSSVSLGARIGAVDYDYSESGTYDYDEVGEGNGVDFMFRMHPGGDGLSGFYFGANAGYWEVDWSSVEVYAPASLIWYDYGTSKLINLNFVIGGKILLGSEHVYIDPSVTLGSWVATSTDSYSNTEPRVGIFIAVGLAIGVNF